MLWIIPAIIISYLVGSIPTAYIFCRLIKKVDIRQHGSGNVGATNASRILGKKLGVLVLVLDILKGFVPVLFLGDLIAARTPGLDKEITFGLLGIACIFGHNWTVFLNFKGGKGMATSLGVLLGLAVKIAGLRPVLALGVLTWLLIFIVTRIVSLGSILAAISLPVYAFLLKQPNSLLGLTIFLSFLVVLRHRPNIKRLLKGQEKRL